MKIVLIHGQSHKGSTYYVSRMLAEKLEGEIAEFFLPRDFGSFCVGCTQCFAKSETLCPHYEKLRPITQAMDEADVLILESPVYVYHATGAMKTFLDHYGYRWMIHRPEETMFRKQAVCISTAAGAGMKSTNKDMSDSLFFWGVAKTYKLGIRAAATSWKGIKPETKEMIDKKTTKLAKEIRSNVGKVKPGIRTRGFFAIARMLQIKGFTETDKAYWNEKGWLGKKRPWK